jgi:molybdate transport system substrate-binding protein
MLEKMIELHPERLPLPRVKNQFLEPFLLPNSPREGNPSRLTVKAPGPYDAICRTGSRSKRRMKTKSAVMKIAACTLAVLGTGIGFASFIAGCGKRTESAAIHVAAASDLQTVLPRVIEQFERKAGVKVTPAFGASGQLAEQIKAGAPFDIFLAANQAFVSELASQGLIKPDTVRPYARGSLVVAVHHEASGHVGRLEDLTNPAVKKIALANPDTAPYGKAGKQALERAGLWKQIEPKIVLAESVRQVLLYVQEGNAEAGLVGRSIARVDGVTIVEIPESDYDPIIQALGIVSASSHSAEAESFAEFVLGHEGQGILREFGLSSVGASHE